MRKLHFSMIAAILFCSSRVAADEQFQVVELFEAMEAGQVAVKFIPANAAKANVLIENKTDLFLHVELPDAIAAVPVLAQFGELGQNGGQQGGQTQGVGGGLNGGNAQGPGIGNAFGGGGGNNFAQPNNGRMGGGGGFMRIAPEKTRKLTARTVCLEHGKPDPNPRIAYRMIPIEEFTDNVKVAELCRRLGRGEVAQKSAQAAAWHLANGLSWKEIAAINKLESRYLGNIKFFNPTEISDAKKCVESLAEPKSDSRSDYVSAR